MFKWFWTTFSLGAPDRGCYKSISSKMQNLQHVSNSTITWFFSDFIKYLGDVDLGRGLSLDWVKYLCISWSGKWRFFAYTVACYTVHISFVWFRRNRAGPSCNIFINPLECVFVRNRGGKWRGSACILFEILISRHNSKKEFEPVSVCFAVSSYICILSGHNTII